MIGKLSRLVGIAAACTLTPAARTQCGTAWQSPPFAQPDSPAWLLAAGNGDLLATGSFTTIGGQAAARVARWNGTVWSPITAPPGITYLGSVLELPGGSLAFAGSFSNAGGSYAVALWSGQAWLYELSGVLLMSLATTSSGTLYAAGPGLPGNIAARNGTTWQPLGSGLDHWLTTPPYGPANVAVSCICPLPNGHVVVSGDFNLAGGLSVNDIAQWNGSTWQSASGVQRLVAAKQARDGSVLAIGDFTAPNQVARWSNGAWQPLGPGFGSAVEARLVGELPGGDVVAAGVSLPYLPGGNTSWLARWNGSVWTQIGTFPGIVTSLAMAGPLLFASRIQAPPGSAEPFLLSLGTSCVPTSASVGSLCPGATTLGALSASSLPWCGETFRARVDGVPAGSLGAAVFGLAPAAIPLPSSIAGCTLLATPDLVTAHVPSNGAIETSLAIPSGAAFAGLVLFHQVVGIAVSPGAIDLTATNALQLVLGSF